MPTFDSAFQPHPNRLPRWLRIVAISVASLAAVLVLAFVGFLFWLRSATVAALPALDGDMHLPGLSAPVTVSRDAHGVPHIDAATQDDLFFAQGYITAQDRLWQMDAFRRNSLGELAEIMGPSLVKHDETQRLLLIGPVAERLAAHMSPDDRRRMEDYARGVNLYIAQCERNNTLPIEFRLLHYQPRPWTVVDSASVILMMVEELDTHAWAKYGRMHVAAKLNNPQLESDLYPVGSWRDHPPTGVDVDLSAPHPELQQPTGDDDESMVTAGASPAGAKAPIILKALLARLKPCPCYKASFECARASFSATCKAPTHIAKLIGPAKAVPLLQSSPMQVFPQPVNSCPDTACSSNESFAGQRGTKSETWEGPQATTVTSLLELLGLPTCDGCAYCSNNWVIAGSHTASGKPLLANDMHLAPSVPNIWYMADLRAPGYHATGVTLPGVPFVVAGHNDHVAWGFTALMADVQDLYIEKLDGHNNYQGIDGQWHPLAVDHETIHVRFSKDVTLDVQSTAHGPLMNRLLAPGDPPIALKWTIYDPALNSVPLYAMNTAASWTDFSAALAQWPFPAQNLVYSDDQGHIAYHAIGQLPMRPAGLVNVPIADTTHEWQGYIPFDQMPNAFDPPSGFLATANSRVTTDQSPNQISDEWIDPYRIERIYKLLNGRDHLTPKDMLDTQTDIYSEVDQEFGQRFAYAIDHTSGSDGNGDPRMRQAADLMRTWDGRLTVDSAAASIVTRAREVIWPMILEPKLGKTMYDYHWEERNFALEEIVMHAKPEWLPSNYKSWDALLTAAVRKAITDGHAPGDLSRWTYGSWHTIDIEHPLSHFLPFLGNKAGTGRQPISGDVDTVKQIGSDVAPSQRFTMDWSNIDGSTENIVLGESGNPLSPYFRDQWSDWYNGTTFALPFTSGAVAVQTRHTLRLEP
ncbi:MAG: penicillin acylase family protein [Terracidiphilus sp.]